ncbi:MAG: T9SS type A sorting domain-containing protein [Bacteroidia bacterium]|nr:T9SS type A sorting domain-containing protein [Bacteroidia bacterium]
MVNEPNTFGTPTQIGIKASQLLSNSDINQNNISGATSYSAGVKAVSTSANALMAVRCNTTAYTARGLEFNGIQTITMLEDNTMSNQTYGLVLDNSAKLTSTLSTFVMGTSTRPTNNVWLNSWTVPNYKTLTTGGSSAQNGKLYVRYSSATLDPDGSGNNFGGTIPGDNYYHTPVSGTLTLLSSSNVSPSCRISGGGDGGSGRMMSDSTNEHIIALLEQSATDSTIFNELSNEGGFINKNTVFRTLKANTGLLSNSSYLNNFYNSIQNTSVKQLFDIEEAIANGNLILANSYLSNFTPSNLVETNYKNFYLVCLNVKDSTFSSADSLTLENIAKSCPYTSGNVVHQARSLYNILYKTYKTFYDDCQSLASRKGSTPKNNIQIKLKTELYPNPNNGNFTIRINNAKEKQSVEISIFDMNGKLLIREDKTVTNSEVNLSQLLLNGAYTVKIKLADGTYDQHKIIINK